MNPFNFITRWFQERKLARLQAENFSLWAQTAAARAELADSPLSTKTLGQLRKRARRYPHLAAGCQAELKRRLYNGRLQLSRDGREGSEGKRVKA